MEATTQVDPKRRQKIYRLVDFMVDTMLRLEREEMAASAGKTSDESPAKEPNQRKVTSSTRK